MPRTESGVETNNLGIVNDFKRAPGERADSRKAGQNEDRGCILFDIPAKRK